MTEHHFAHPSKVTQLPKLIRGVERRIAELRVLKRDAEADVMQAALDLAASTNPLVEPSGSN